MTDDDLDGEDRAEDRAYEFERMDAAAALSLQNITRICNGCGHRWVAEHGTTICPECREEDSITETDLLTAMADHRV